MPDGMRMKIVKYRYFNFLLHALAWSIVLFFPYLISDAESRYRIGPLPGVYFTLSGIIHMIIFYTNAFFLFPRFLNRKYWPLYIASAFLLVLSSIILKFYLLEWGFPNDEADVRSHVVIPSVMVFTVSVFYCITIDRIRAEKLQKENEALQLGMELKFLRSQISPHFLFNVLTNLVSLARKKSDHLEESLLMLSDLMRYMLYNANKKIALHQEVEYLTSYIELQRLRFGQDVKIIFHADLAEEAGSYCIEPMLLIPFVENAFKHGTGYPDEPFIEIHLRAREHELIFSVTNKFDREKDASKDKSSGIGLKNVRARLTLLYPQKHDLVIQGENNLFHIQLTLKE